MTGAPFDPMAALRALTEAGIDYVVIGGIAGRLHGSVTVTNDLDICYDRSPENLERLSRVLIGAKARLRGVDDDVPFIPDPETLAAGDTFTFATEFGNLDVIGSPSGVAGFASLAAGAVDYDIDGITVLAGSEVNIHTDGSLDYEDDLLAQLDWIMASMHTSFRISEKGMTARMVAAMEHTLVDALAHPTGRLIDRREPYGLDIEQVVEAAIRTGTFLEINANPDRRDLNEWNARLAARRALGPACRLGRRVHLPRQPRAAGGAAAGNPRQPAAVRRPRGLAHAPAPGAGGRQSCAALRRHRAGFRLPLDRGYRCIGIRGWRRGSGAG